MTISRSPELADVSGASPQGGTRFESVGAAAYASAVFILGSLSTLITPALLSGWFEQYQWSTTWLGWIATAELVGTFFGSLSAFYWQRRFNWRRTTVAAIVLIIAVNLACAASGDFETIVGLRVVSGFAGGILIAIYTAYAANVRSPERLIAITTFFQILAQATMMVAAASLVGRFGMNGIYGLLSACVIVLLPIVRLLPIGWPQDTPSDGEAAEVNPSMGKWLAGFMVLAGLASFEIFQGGTFAFLDQFGARAGLDTAETLHIIGLSAIGSMLGPLAAFALGERIGIAGPLAAACAVLAVLMTDLALVGPVSPTMLLIEISMLQAVWLFAICYLYAGLIKVNNVMTQAGTPVSSLALAGGAALTGFTIQGFGTVGLLWITLACLAMTAAFALPPIVAAGRKHET